MIATWLHHPASWRWQAANKQAINQAGAIPLLIAMLTPGSATAGPATEALGALAATDNKNKNDIRAAGGVSALIKLQHWVEAQMRLTRAQRFAQEPSDAPAALACCRPSP